MSLIVCVHKGRVFVQPVAEEPDFDVDAPREEVKPGETFWDLTYAELIEFGSGVIHYDEDGNRTDTPLTVPEKRPPL